MAGRRKTKGVGLGSLSGALLSGGLVALVATSAFIGISLGGSLFGPASLQNVLVKGTRARADVVRKIAELEFNSHRLAIEQERLRAKAGASDGSHSGVGDLRRRLADEEAAGQSLKSEVARLAPRLRAAEELEQTLKDSVGKLQVQVDERQAQLDAWLEEESQSRQGAVLQQFVKSWYEHQKIDDAVAWASDFAPLSEYCYYDKPGLAPREWVREDRMHLIRRFRKRDYEMLNVRFEPLESPLVRVVILFRYKYQGVRESTSRRSEVQMDLIITDGKAEIVRFVEKIL